MPTEQPNIDKGKPKVPVTTSKGAKTAPDQAKSDGEKQHSLMAQHQISPLRPGAPPKSLVGGLLMPGIYYALVATPFASLSFHWILEQHQWPQQQRLIAMLTLVGLLSTAGVVFSLGWLVYRHQKLEDQD
ncbi:hypothetical protein [Leptolyngbya sp. FACHB-261]|uniref:hypothetical protein n=1 Tax=Leptolyngbya sp. FACHB-261 TaxID=2692806 RepID=UPI001686AAF5|nr:hypothetical protein [Leptolyngbya sp. FACHB-261]MBD2105138.1 hypothetical protein [Leptolyngbya sp. FACHB-261]